MLDQGATDLALADFQLALEQDRRNIEALFGIGKAYVLLGGPQQAIKPLTAAITADDQNAEAYRLRAQAYSGVGKNEEAHADIEKSLSINPDDHETHIALATILTAALTVAVGMPFNYANIIALPLLVGLGVDNGIHVVHRMRHEHVGRLFDTSTMRAVLASALTTIASFGNLAFSSHVGTASMGILLALGLAASMTATLVVLPAWLVLRSARRRAEA